MHMSDTKAAITGMNEKWDKIAKILPAETKKFLKKKKSCHEIRSLIREIEVSCMHIQLARVTPVVIFNLLLSLSTSYSSECEKKLDRKILISLIVNTTLEQKSSQHDKRDEKNNNAWQSKLFIIRRSDYHMLRNCIVFKLFAAIKKKYFGVERHLLDRRLLSRSFMLDNFFFSASYLWVTIIICFYEEKRESV